MDGGEVSVVNANGGAGDYANGGAAETGQVVKKLVGGIYQCEICGADYECHSTRQKYCPDCTAANKKSVMLRKKKRPTA